MPRQSAARQHESNVSSTSSPHHSLRRQHSKENSWLYDRDISYIACDVSLNQKAIHKLPVACHGKQAGVVHDDLIYKGTTGYITFSIAISTQHRENVVSAYRVRTGMISRSSFVCASSAVPLSRTVHSLDRSPTVLVPVPHVHRTKWGCQLRFLATIVGLLSLALSNFDGSAVCMSRPN